MKPVFVIVNSGTLYRLSTAQWERALRASGNGDSLAWVIENMGIEPVGEVQNVTNWSATDAAGAPMRLRQAQGAR